MKRRRQRKSRGRFKVNLLVEKKKNAREDRFSQGLMKGRTLNSLLILMFTPAFVKQRDIYYRD